KGFRYADWVKGLNAGRSFVTTGPMLLVCVDDQAPGSTIAQGEPAPRKYRVTGAAFSARPLHRIEIIVNGAVAQTLKPQNLPTKSGGHESAIDVAVPIDGSSWIAVRCFEERPDGRPRFAHSAPVHVVVKDRPLRPRRAESEFLVKRVADQLSRSEGVLP